MKIISGKLKGRKIMYSPSKFLRPTSAIMRECLLNTLHHRYPEDAKGDVLDAFAGTGAVALEMLSWGARSVTLVEKSYNHARIIKETFMGLNYNLLIKNFFKTRAEDYNGLVFSCIFLDPPYHLKCMSHAIKHIIDLKITSPDSILIYERLTQKSIKFEKEDIPTGLVDILFIKPMGTKELVFFSIKRNIK